MWLYLWRFQMLYDHVRGPGLEGKNSRIELLLVILRGSLLYLFVSHDGLHSRVRVVHQQLINGLYWSGSAGSCFLSWCLLIVSCRIKNLGLLLSSWGEYLLIDQHHQILLALRMLLLLLHHCLHWLSKKRRNSAILSRRRPSHSL